jgi:uncharacterized protein
MQVERRLTEGLEIETREDGQVKLNGLGIVFNKWSLNLGGFIEMIEPDAVRGIDFTDAVSLFNHRDDNILGRVPDTMTVSVEEAGVRYIVDLPDSPIGQNVRVAVQRKDVKGSSFGFTVDQDTWFKREDGVWERRIKQFKRIYDISPVVFPAYPDTTVAMRSLEDVQKTEFTGRRLYYFKLENEILKLR